MIEVAFCYDFHPDIDEEQYARLARHATALMREAPGFVEFRAHRNLTGSPHVRRTTVWSSLSAWAAFAERPDFQAVNSEFRTYVTHLDVQLWGASPLVPEPLGPK